MPRVSRKNATTNSHPAFAIFAHRSTGQLQTIARADVADLNLREWMFVCAEPTDILDPSKLPDAERLGQYEDPIRFTLRHHHDYGVAQPTCPTLKDCCHEAVQVLPPEEWQADDLRDIHRHAVGLLDDDALIWTIGCGLFHGKPRTKIEITRGRHRARGDARLDHSLEIVYAGRPSAATLAWMLRDSGRFAMSVAFDCYAPDQDGHPGIFPIARKPRSEVAR